MKKLNTALTNSFPVFNILAAAVLIAIIGFTSGANATKMRSGSAGMTAAMGDCLAASDSQMVSAETRTACCSKEAGICVICPKPESPGMMCDVVNYSRFAVPDDMTPGTGSSIKGKTQ